MLVRGRGGGVVWGGERGVGVPSMASGWPQVAEGREWHPFPFSLVSGKREG
jgi:hypothetical protein